MTENEPRWKRAVNSINANLGEMLGKLYVEKHFKPEAKARMDQLVDNLRRAFREGIDGLEWMGPETKKQAQAKLAKFRPKVGYPTPSFAMRRCASKLTNPHAPDMYRANGPLRNVPEFYETFAVKDGDKMFLPQAERTKIW